MVQQISTNTFGVAKWVVSPDPTQGTHTTISAAMASASSGDTIWVRDGTYVENITPTNGVTLQASSSSHGFGVIVNGTLNITNQTFAIDSFYFNTTGASCVSITGAAATNLLVTNCLFQNTGASTLVCSNSNAASTTVWTGCDFVCDNSSAAFAWSAAFLGDFYSCKFSSAAPTTLSTISAGVMNFHYCFVGVPCSTSGTGLAFAAFTAFGSGLSGNNCFVVGASPGTSVFDFCTFATAGAAPLVVNTAALTIGCSFQTNTGILIDGTGTVQYAFLFSTFGNPAVFANTLTVLGNPVRIGNSTNLTSVNSAASPYTVLSTDQFFLIDSSAGAVSLLFPNAPASGQQWTVKDATGSAATHNITVTTVSGTSTIDGATSQVLSTNFQSIQLIGTSATTYAIY